MWQFPTIPAIAETPTSDFLRRTICDVAGDPRPIGRVDHDLTHRRYRFDAYLCIARHPKASPGRRWVTLHQLQDCPLSRPQLRIAQLLADVQ